jgi:molecular chaperone GrpE
MRARRRWGACRSAVRTYFVGMMFPGHLTDPFARLGAPVALHPRRSGARPARHDGHVRRPAPPPEAQVSPAADTATEHHSSTDQQRLREAVGELEAAKRRVERDAQRVQNETRAQLVARLFPVLDSLDRSVAAGSRDTALLEGVKLVRAQLEQALSEYGLERIESVGQPFDPAQHEAVDVVRVDTPSKHGMVVEQWEAGYRFGDRVLRAAKVRVGKLH